MVAAGYPVPRPRSTQEPFHTTVGVVNPSVCPAAELLTALNGNITVFTPEPVLIDSFDLAFPPVHVVAHNDTARSSDTIASLPRRQRFFAQKPK